MSDIRLVNVSKYYIHKQSAIAVLNELNLIIPSEQITIVQGPSGCGKSTLLKVIAGLLKPEEGHLYINDRDVTHLDSNERHLGYISQSIVLYPHMTIFDNLAYPLKQAGVPVEEMKRRVFDIAKLLDIELLLSRKPKVLSGGQQQKVAIGRALIKQPSILLMDEPFSNLDIKTALILTQLLKDIQTKLRLTMVIVTHRELDSSTLGDTIVTMDNGQIQSMSKKVTTDD